MELTTLHDNHFFLEGRVSSEQGWALEKAKELVVTGDVSCDTDWEKMMDQEWKKGAIRRLDNADKEKAELARRKEVKHELIAL